MVMMMIRRVSYYSSGSFVVLLVLTIERLPSVFKN